MIQNSTFPSGLTDLWEVAPGVIGLRTLFVNVAYISLSPTEWILVDAGLGMFAGSILKTATDRFGVPPLAIILTHGHFDHVGTLKELLEEWKVSVYAHPLELPYLTGQRDYPAPDPSVGGGLMAVISPLYPHRSIDLGSSVLPLPADGSVPGMSDWRWIHTPGHSPGHISLFREQDRVLVSGDAFITVKQESALAVVTQHQEIHGPPMYFTTDWAEAEASVRTLAQLNPSSVLTGHGLPMDGRALSEQLTKLSEHFKEMAVPEQGKFV